MIALIADIMNKVKSLFDKTGTNAEAATDPSAASGTVFSKLRGAGDNLDTIITATGTNAEASTDPSAASGTLFSKLRGVGDDLDTVKGYLDTEITAILTDTGDGTDTVVAPGVAGSLHAHIREAQEQADLIYARQGAPVGASQSADVAAVQTVVNDIDTDMGEPTDANSAATLHGRMAVQSANVSTNVHMRDVVGNKGDNAVTTADSATSLTGYSKGILSDTQFVKRAAIASPTADSIADQLNSGSAGYQLRKGLYSFYGAATSVGTTSVINDTAANFATNSLAGLKVIFASGNNVGQVRRIVSNILNTSITLDPVLPNATANTDKYFILGAEDLASTIDSNEAVTSAGAIGNKSDTALIPSLTVGTNNTASVVRYLKTIMARTIGPTSTDDTTGAASASPGATLGRKDDTPSNTIDNTSTIMRYVKGLIGATSIANVDAVSNTLIRDGIGNKTDTAVTVAGTEKSLMAYSKGIINRMPTSGTVSTVTDVQAGATVASANVATNTNSRDVLGNKTDAAVTATAADKSIIAYSKGTLDLLNNGTYGLSAIETLVDELESRTGTNSEASTDPSAASGTIFSKLRGAGDNLDTLIAALSTLQYDFGAETGPNTETSVSVPNSTWTTISSTTLTNPKGTAARVTLRTRWEGEQKWDSAAGAGNLRVVLTDSNSRAWTTAAAGTSNSTYTLVGNPMEDAGIEWVGNITVAIQVYQNSGATRTGYIRNFNVWTEARC